MPHFRLNKIYQVIIPVVVLFLVVSCANIGRPGGGPKDETPPRLMKSFPAQGQTNFSKKKSELIFDEIVLVEQAAEKVTVSPPQTIPPLISAIGKKISVELKDSLRKNTTYTIDFSDAIVDNNEKNPFNNFALSFSTGKQIDTLQVSGTLLNAADLEPVTGMFVGLHSMPADSAFEKKPFEKITRTDMYGQFNIKNVAPGKYRIYALKDANRDYRFDQPGEDIAFSDSVVVPAIGFEVVPDTLKINGKDSVRTVRRNVFLPGNLLLRSFNENFKAQYLDKSERRQRNKISLYFKAPAAEMPRIKVIDYSGKKWCRTERSATCDTLHYWITDSALYKQDTIRLEAVYLKTDTLHRLVPQTDTLQFVYKDPKMPAPKKKKAKEKEKEQKTELPSLMPEIVLSGIIDIVSVIKIAMPLPVDTIRFSGFHLSEKVDTLWKEVKLSPLERDSFHIRDYFIRHKWKPGKEYRLAIDSASVYGINGLCNRPLERVFKVKTEEEYGALFFTINGIKDSAFVELLNENDKMVRTEPVVNNSAEFFYLNPGIYYARLIKDRNGNKKWDTGNYKQRLQPEEVFYYPSAVRLRANFDVGQDWNPTGQPLSKQKPIKLVKNKPKVKDTEQSEKTDTENGEETEQN